MKGIYFSQIKPQEASLGAVKKVFDEIKTFENAGFEMRHVNFRPVSEGLRKTFLGKGVCSAIPFTYVFSKYTYSHEYDGYDFYYFRFEAADYWFTRFLRLLKKNNPGSKVIIEFPDFPYTYWMSTIFHSALRIKDFVARSKYAGVVDRFAVLDAQYRNIYNVPTLNFKNGINVERISMRKTDYRKGDDIHVVGVCTMFPFHGFDRMLAGMAVHYKDRGTCGVYFHVVGDGPGNELPKYKKFVEKSGISEYVIFEGQKTGEDIDVIYDKCQIAVCSLGMHRVGLSSASSLKTREYLSKGFPLITGCPIDVFEGEPSDFVLEFDNDDTPIDITKVIDFAEKVYADDPQDVIRRIRDFAIQKCDFSVTMGNILDYLKE